MDGSQLPMTFRSWVVDWKHHYFLDYLTYTSEYMKNYTFKKKLIFSKLNKIFRTLL